MPDNDTDIRQGDLVRFTPDGWLGYIDGRVTSGVAPEGLLDVETEAGGFWVLPADCRLLDRD